MHRPIGPQILPAIIFGGLPFYIAAIFWFFPNQMVAMNKFTGSVWPKLSERIYTPRNMKIVGLAWAAFGLIMWACIIFG